MKGVRKHEHTQVVRTADAQLGAAPACLAAVATRTYEDIGRGSEGSGMIFSAGDGEADVLAKWMIIAAAPTLGACIACAPPYGR